MNQIKIKKRNICFVISILVLLSQSLFVGCSKDRLNEVEPSVKEDEVQSRNEFIEVSELGFLHFSSSQALEAYVNEVADGRDDIVQDVEKNTSKKLLAKTNKVNNVYSKSFLSVASWRDNVLNMRRQARKSPSITVNELDEDDIELSEEEERLNEIDELLHNDLLSYILDTSLRIQIEDTVFKITRYGTFSVERDRMDLLASTIATFDTTLIHTYPSGVSIILDNGVVFTNTFAKDESTNAWVSDMDDNDEEESNVLLPEKMPYRAAAQTSKPALHIKNQYGINYNVNSYGYNLNGWQTFWSRFFTTSGHLQHTKKRRAYMTISNLDYGFFKTCQLVLKFQKKKGGMWKMMVAGAPEMVIGINSLTLKGGGLKKPISMKPDIYRFYNINEKKMSFGWSIGISGKIKGGGISYKDISPAAPSCYKMADVDVFGSIFAEGVWRGVRFYQN